MQLKPKPEIAQTFELTVSQKEKVDSIYELLSNSTNNGSKMERISQKYCFTPTGIGDGVQCIFTVTYENGEKQVTEFDITDYENW